MTQSYDRYRTTLKDEESLLLQRVFAIRLLELLCVKNHLISEPWDDVLFVDPSLCS